MSWSYQTLGTNISVGGKRDEFSGRNSLEVSNLILNSPTHSLILAILGSLQKARGLLAPVPAKNYY